VGREEKRAKIKVYLRRKVRKCCPKAGTGRERQELIRLDVRRGKEMMSWEQEEMGPGKRGSTPEQEV
jgi:hypothetical protein